MRIRRLFRYRLRTLLVLTALLSVWSAFYVRSTPKQEEAVQAYQHQPARASVRFCRRSAGLAGSLAYASDFDFSGRARTRSAAGNRG